jgi:hypothetical protein
VFRYLSDRAVSAGHSVIHSDDKTLIQKQFRIFCDCHHIRPAQPPVSLTPLKSDSALVGDQEMTMTTHMRMLSSLALTAAALVTLSSDALARGGMGGGGGGMRSFHVARAPTVVSRVRTTNTAAVRSRTTSATSHTKTKTSHAKTNHCKKGCDSSSDSKTKQAMTNPGSNPDGGSKGKDKDKSAEGRHHHRHHHDNPPPDLSSLLNSASQGSSSSPAIDPNASQGAVSPVAASQGTVSQGTVSQGSGGTVRKRRNVEDRDSRDSRSSPADGDTKDSANPNSANPNPEQDGNGTRPTQAPTQELIGNYPVAVIDQGGGGSGGTSSTGSGGTHQIRTYPIEAPTVSTGNGATPAPVAVDPPGCFYERSVRKPAGGGLQRVILKICPDA